MKKLLWVGDAGVPSGFAKATHAILDVLHRDYDVTVLGINYRGDPHKYPYPIWTCTPGGDFFGVGRLIWMCDMVKPDVIMLQNDGWNIPLYMQQLRKKLPNGEYAFPEHACIPVVAVVAVDGKNFRGKWLDGIAHAIFWTQFALDEARAGGYIGPASVIPLGVDLEVYQPRDKAAMRRNCLPPQLHDAFIVGSVNRNQPRKRWDLLVQYFAEWITTKKIRDAYLYLHTAPTGDTGCDVQQLASYYGIVDRIAIITPETWYGLPEEVLAQSYSCFDVNASTSQGEGFGLTTLEAMACGVPCIVPDWAALGDWARGGATLVPCTTTAVGPPYVNVIGGVADKTDFIWALDGLYQHEALREALSELALTTAREPRFRWSVVGQQYIEVLRDMFRVDVAVSEVVWHDLGRPEEVVA